MSLRNFIYANREAIGSSQSVAVFDFSNKIDNSKSTSENSISD